MPLGYHINPDEGLITVHGGGDVAIADLTHVGTALLEDPEYDPSLPQLLDFRGLRPVGMESDGLDRDLGELWTFIRESYRPRVGANVAVVIDDHLEAHHCADIFLATCALQDAELFADYDQALKWLMRQAFVPATTVAVASAEQQDAGGDQPHGAPE